jgi:hypothetical protein
LKNLGSKFFVLVLARMYFPLECPAIWADRKAYITKLGNPALRTDLVDIFDYSEPQSVGSVSDQQACHEKMGCVVTKMKTETLKPFLPEIDEAKRNPSGWVYRIAGHFWPSASSVQHEAILSRYSSFVRQINPMRKSSGRIGEVVRAWVLAPMKPPTPIDTPIQFAEPILDDLVAMALEQAAEENDIRNQMRVALEADDVPKVLGLCKKLVFPDELYAAETGKINHVSKGDRTRKGVVGGTGPGGPGRDREAVA